MGPAYPIPGFQKEPASNAVLVFSIKRSRLRSCSRLRFRSNAPFGAFIRILPLHEPFISLYCGSSYCLTYFFSCSLLLFLLFYFSPCVSYFSSCFFASLPGFLTPLPGFLTPLPASLTFLPASLTFLPASLTLLPDSLTLLPASLTSLPAFLTSLPVSLPAVSFLFSKHSRPYSAVPESFARRPGRQTSPRPYCLRLHSCCTGFLSLSQILPPAR